MVQVSYNGVAAPSSYRPMPETAGSVLKRHMSSPLANCIGAFSLGAFHWPCGFLCFEAVVAFAFMIATLGWGILLLYFYSVLLVPVLLLQLTTLILLCTFGIQSGCALFTMRQKPGFVSPVDLKRIGRLPHTRSILLGIWSALLAVMTAWTAESAWNAQHLEEGSATFFSPEAYPMFFLLSLVAFAICVLLTVVWAFVSGYFKRLRRFTEGDGYRTDKRPPVGLMYVGGVACLLSLNVSSAVYLFLSAAWFGRIHREMCAALAAWSTPHVTP